MSSGDQVVSVFAWRARLVEVAVDHGLRLEVGQALAALDHASRARRVPRDAALACPRFTMNALA
jgi:hypothetical protein